MAAGIRSRHGHGIAIVGQDNLRRVVLREHDVPGGANIGLIDMVARYALDHGYHVIVEGILYTSRYGETLRRHATKPQATEYGHAEMSSWYRERDFLPGGFEQVITEDVSLDAIVQQVMDDAGLGREDLRDGDLAWGGTGWSRDVDELAE